MAGATLLVKYVVVTVKLLLRYKFQHLLIKVAPYILEGYQINIFFTINTILGQTLKLENFLYSRPYLDSLAYAGLAT